MLFFKLLVIKTLHPDRYGIQTKPNEGFEPGSNDTVPKHWSKLQEKYSALIREHPALQTIKLYKFFLIYVAQFCPSGFASTDMI